MATTYESLLPDIIPMVPGCSDTLIENNVRASVIELCEKAAVYQAELDPVTTVANVFEYDLEPPAGSVVHKVLWVTHKGREIEPITTQLLEQRKPRWRETGYEGTPEYYVKVSQSLLHLVPVPSETIASSTILRAQLKPSQSSQSSDDELMSDYRETIIYGALYRLLRLPSKDWTDYAGAQVYGSLFNEGIVEAERRGRHADTNVSRTVKYGGIYSGVAKRRNRYGRESG
jgi:hypothetical protein